MTHDRDWTKLEKQDFLFQAKALAQQDHELSLQFIDMLRECERRMLYAEQGYPSLWAWATQYLGLSENMAQIRISAMRLSREIPEVKPALQSGALSLSNAAQLNRFFREEKKLGTLRSEESKKEVIDQVKGLSKRQCESKLLQICPKAIPQEKVRTVSSDQTEIKLILNSELIDKLNELKAILAHALPNATYGELIAYLTEKQLQNLSKAQGGARKLSTIRAEGASESAGQLTQSDSKTLCPDNVNGSADQSNGSSKCRPYISKAIRQIVRQRAGHCCEYVSPEGKRCSSGYALEIDHCTPIALGGASDANALRLLCRTHNRQQAVEKLGQTWMSQFVASLGA